MFAEWIDDCVGSKWVGNMSAVDSARGARLQRICRLQHRPDLRGLLSLPADHYTDLALPKHDHGEQGPGETGAQDTGEEHPPQDLHLHQALLRAEGWYRLSEVSLDLQGNLFSVPSP